MDDALLRVLWHDEMGLCHGVGLGITLTNLFGKNPYKEALAISQSMIKEDAQQISSLKIVIVELTKGVEVVEKEHVVRNEMLVSNSLLSLQCTFLHINDFNSNITLLI